MASWDLVWAGKMAQCYTWTMETTEGWYHPDSRYGEIGSRMLESRETATPDHSVPPEPGSTQGSPCRSERARPIEGKGLTSDLPAPLIRPRPGSPSCSPGREPATSLPLALRQPASRPSHHWFSSAHRGPIHSRPPQARHPPAIQAADPSPV